MMVSLLSRQDRRNIRTTVATRCEPAGLPARFAPGAVCPTACLIYAHLTTPQRGFVNRGADLFQGARPFVCPVRAHERGVREIHGETNGIHQFLSIYMTNIVRPFPQLRHKLVEFIPDRVIAALFGKVHGEFRPPARAARCRRRLGSSIKHWTIRRVAERWAGRDATQGAVERRGRGRPGVGMILANCNILDLGRLIVRLDLS